ncbi:hypothetical protein B0H14DRAFT_3158735 [Mycena olivaceomarginata]|nr:hypothetical protein B0H14DRAFT_3158735 [Mycena olivaceomarginata]
MYALKIPAVRGLFTTMPQVKLRSSSLQSMFPQFTRFNPCSPSKICKMASDLCCVASKFCLQHLAFKLFCTPTAPVPDFPRLTALDFGLRTDCAAAECLVFFAQFPETLCLSPSMIRSNDDYLVAATTAPSHLWKDVYLTIVLKIIQRVSESVTSLARTATTSDSHGIPNATGSSSFDCGAVPHLPFKINYPAHDCAIQHPQIPFHFLGFRRLRGQLNPTSPCIPDALFFPSQPVKAIPLESELWCVTVLRTLPQYFRFREDPRAR